MPERKHEYIITNRDGSTLHLTEEQARDHYFKAGNYYWASIMQTLDLENRAVICLGEDFQPYTLERIPHGESN